MAKKKRKYLTKKQKQAAILAKARAVLAEKRAAAKKVQVPVNMANTEAATDNAYVDGASSLIETIRELNPKNTPVIEAPKEYSDGVIGETILSISNTLRIQSQHDVLLMLPQLVKDIVDEAYDKGYSAGNKLPGDSNADSN